MRKFLIMALLAFWASVAVAQGSGPAGLADDMLATNERLHLPAAVISFDYEKDDLDDEALLQLAAVAAMIDAAGSEARFYIVGTADAEKASPRHNQKLSASRCNAVCRALARNHGVDVTRLVPIPAGGIDDNPRQQAHRMVIIIPCTPDTRNVVERWYPNY